jgi:periplasmic divalent cation tolerance protein
MKTTIARLSALEKVIIANHPYDTPEIVVLPISRGHKRYLEWVEQSVQ